MGTREGIFNLRTICERTLEVGKEVQICFIDYTKVFDRVKHSKMVECLQEIEIDDEDLQIITKMYWEQSAVVRTEFGTTTEFQIKKEVRQGCVLSSSLFNLYTEKIFKEVEEMNGVVIGGVNISNLRYPDDTALICFCPIDLQSLVTVVNDAVKPYGMEMNIIKTRTMVVGKTTPTPRRNIMFDGKSIEQTDKMVYLGGLLTAEGKCEKEVTRRKALAKSVFHEMSRVLKSRNINMRRILQCYIWSTLLYGCETWTLTKTMGRKLEAFDMWVYRRMLRVSWTEHTTIEEVLKMVNTTSSLLLNKKENASILDT